MSEFSTYDRWKTEGADAAHMEQVECAQCGITDYAGNMTYNDQTDKNFCSPLHEQEYITEASAHYEAAAEANEINEGEDE